MHLSGLLIVALAATAGDPSATGFQYAKHKDSKYGLFIPHSYKAEKEYPLILFLHGAGERGDDGVAPVKQGIGNAIKPREKDFSFIVIFPQCAKNSNWKAGSPDSDRALAILAEVEKKYKVDPKRVYLTGLSMGGFGTWSLAAAHPNKWAAIAPICGGGDPATAEKIKHIPTWCFHGDADTAVKVDLSRSMIKALKDVGAEPIYTEYPKVGHNSWDRAYGTAELYPWFLKHTAK